MPSLHFLRVLQVVLACVLICPALAVGARGDDEETCAQGFTPAKRTLQATQRNSQHTVMSSAEQVSCEACASFTHPYQSTEAPFPLA